LTVPTETPGDLGLGQVLPVPQHQCHSPPGAEPAQFRDELPAQPSALATAGSTIPLGTATVRNTSTVPSGLVQVCEIWQYA
jgi:hypothetical protein